MVAAGIGFSHMAAESVVDDITVVAGIDRREAKRLDFVAARVRRVIVLLLGRAMPIGAIVWTGSG